MLEGDQCRGREISPEDVPLPFAVLAPDGRALACNAAFLELTGYRGGGCESLPSIVDLIPPEWRPGFGTVVPGPGSTHFSTKLMAKDGTRIAAEAFVRRVDDDQGQPCRFLVSLIDTATIWTLETGLIQAEQKSSLASLVLDEIGAPVFATDEESRIIYANEASRRLFSRPTYDVIGTNLWDVYPVSQQDLFYRMYQRAFQERRTFSCDHYARKLNLWYEVRFYPWVGGGGIVVTLNNITARKQYERFMGLAAYTVNRTGEYIFWLSHNGKIIRANDIASKNLCFPEKSRERAHISEVSMITESDWEHLWGEIKDKGIVTLDLALCRRKGGIIPTEASVSYVVYVGQEYGIIIARDISPRLRVEQELRNSQEQAELYLDLMSHDIRNMNQIGIGFLEMALGDPRLSAEQKALLEKPLEAFNRSTELIGNVKKLQQATGSLAMEAIDLAGMLHDVIAHYEEVQGRAIKIEFGPAEGCCVVANPLLKEVFSNLIGNAIKHSEGRLTIWVSLRKAMIADTPCCEVTIADNGPGISDEAKPKLFSTNLPRGRDGRYRGLGLILVKTLLDDFGGSIDVGDRVPGDSSQGARFVVTLPAVDKGYTGILPGRFQE